MPRLLECQWAWQPLLFLLDCYGLTKLELRHPLLEALGLLVDSPAEEGVLILHSLRCGLPGRLVAARTRVSERKRLRARRQE